MKQYKVTFEYVDETQYFTFIMAKSKGEAVEFVESHHQPTKIIKVELV